jgi:hypothetical protein
MKIKNVAISKLEANTFTEQQEASSPILVSIGNILQAHPSTIFINTIFFAKSIINTLVAIISHSLENKVPVWYKNCQKLVTSNTMQHDC